MKILKTNICNFNLKNLILTVLTTCLFNHSFAEVDKNKANSANLVCTQIDSRNLTQDQIFEKYKSCAVQYLNDQFDKKDLKYSAFVSDLVKNIEESKTYYSSDLKRNQIRNILKREKFIPEQAILILIGDFKKNITTKINFIEIDKNILAPLLDKTFKVINPKVNEKIYKEQRAGKIADAIQSELNSKLIELLKEFKFAEADLLLQNALNTLGKSDLVSIYRIEILLVAEEFYMDIIEIDKTISIIQDILALDIKSRDKFNDHLIKFIFFKADYKRCSEFKENSVVVQKYKLFCDIESGKLSVVELLKKIDGLKEIKNSSDNYIHLKSELFIANNQFNEAFDLLKSGQGKSNKFRLVDMMLKLKKKSEALATAYEINPSDVNKGTIWQLNKNIRLSFLYFINKPDVNEYKKHFKYIKPICDNLIKVTSSENTLLIDSCKTVTAILESDSVAAVKKYLVLNKHTSPRKTHNTNIIEILGENL